MSLQEDARRRILVLDGAMGTMIQSYGLCEADFRGTRFADVPGQMKGAALPDSPLRITCSCVSFPASP